MVLCDYSGMFFRKDIAMSMGMSMSCSQRVETTQRMSAELRLDLQLSLRLELLEAIYGEQYHPTGDCPSCNRKMTKVEILKGFRNDPTDFTTKCTDCGHRFQPKLIARTAASSVEMPFFCADQTLAQLCGKEEMSVEQLELSYLGVYRSALVHFGSLAAAFARNGVSYAREAMEHWKAKVHGFLGKLTDKLIAECVSAPVKEVRAYRRELQIPCYNAHNWRAIVHMSRVQ